MPTIYLIILLILLALAVVFLIAGYYFFSIAMPRTSHFFDNWGSDDSYGDYAEEFKRNKAEINSHPCEWVSIQSDDGLTLKARYYDNPKAKRAVLLAHGYRGSGEGDFASAFAWIAKDATVLLIDERTTNKSEGDYITFGAKEKLDVLKWSHYLADRTGGQLPIYLYGISLGSATVMMTSCLDLPQQTRGIIADCGYTSMQDILASLSWRWFHVPAYPLVWAVGFWCKVKAGFRMSDADARKALIKAKVPVLFIHGKKDGFVLPENTDRNYQACASPKEILWVEGAKHGLSHHVDPEAYEAKVEEFFRKTSNRKD